MVEVARIFQLNVGYVRVAKDRHSTEIRRGDFPGAGSQKFFPGDTSECLDNRGRLQISREPYFL